MTAADGAEASARAFGSSLLARDPRAAAAYFAPGAHILTPDGTGISGREQVITVLSQITSSQQELEIHMGSTVITGAVALCTQVWWRRSPQGAGEVYEASSVARLVLAHSGARWEIVIASPWD